MYRQRQAINKTITGKAKAGRRFVSSMLAAVLMLTSAAPYTGFAADLQTEGATEAAATSAEASTNSGAAENGGGACE